MVYLIHFFEKLRHAQHYIGFVDNNLKQRIKKHQSNKGVKLLASVNRQGITWEALKAWEEGTHELEHKFKNWKKAKCFCPVCRNKH